MIQPSHFFPTMKSHGPFGVERQLLREEAEGGLAGLRKVWLGGLDSNQDNQIQNLMYCQLYDLPIFWKSMLNNFSESSV